MKCSKVIRQFTSVLTALGLIITVSTASHAFTKQTSTPITATASVTGGSAAMSVALLNNGGGSAPAITWTAAAGNSWTVANQFVQIASTLTVVGSGIQTYTDNVRSNPAYTGTISSNTSSPAGLVNTGNTAATPVPTAWQIRAQGVTPEVVDDPNNTGIGRTGWAWFYHQDKSQVANNQGVTGPWVDGTADPYHVMEQSGQPPSIHFSQSQFGNSTSNVNNVYLEANFQNALGGSSYKTTTLTVELFTL